MFDSSGLEKQFQVKPGKRHNFRLGDI